jgi:glycosyltransferase involved in cell wall biosynthesis
MLIGKIKASKVLVLPSSREGFGMAVIEAFACGVPVVTVKERYNAAQELVDDGMDGFVVKLDADEIRVGIKKIIQEDIDYKEVVERVFCKAKKYDWNEVVTKILLAYRK